MQLSNCPDTNCNWVTFKAIVYIAYSQIPRFLVSHFHCFATNLLVYVISLPCREPESLVVPVEKRNMLSHLQRHDRSMQDAASSSSIRGVMPHTHSDTQTHTLQACVHWRVSCRAGKPFWYKPGWQHALTQADRDAHIANTSSYYDSALCIMVLWLFGVCCILQFHQLLTRNRGSRIAKWQKYLFFVCSCLYGNTDKDWAADGCSTSDWSELTILTPISYRPVFLPNISSPSFKSSSAESRQRRPQTLWHSWYKWRN